MVAVGAKTEMSDATGELNVTPAVTAVAKLVDGLAHALEIWLRIHEQQYGSAGGVGPVVMPWLQAEEEHGVYTRVHHRLVSVHHELVGVPPTAAH